MLYLFFFSIHHIKSTPIEGENFTSHINQYESLASYSNLSFSCRKLEIIFVSNVKAICNNDKQTLINLTDLDYFNAEIYSELVIKNMSHIDLDDYVLQIGRSVLFRRNSTVKFIKFWNFSLIQTFRNMHQNVKLTPWVSLPWNQFIHRDQYICPWDQDYYYNNFIDNKLFIRDMLLETMKDLNWTKLCLNTDGWLIYHEKQDRKIDEEVEAHEIALLYALITTILIIVLVVLSLFLIAFFRYKKGMTKKCPVENEFSLSMSLSSSSSSGSGSKPSNNTTS